MQKNSVGDLVMVPGTQFILVLECLLGVAAWGFDDLQTNLVSWLQIWHRNNYVEYLNL